MAFSAPNNRPKLPDYQSNYCIVHYPIISQRFVNKKTEAIYAMNTDFNNSSNGRFARWPVFEDNSENIYIRTYFMIYKLNVKNPSEIKLSEYIPKEQSIDKYAVNKRGVCYWGRYDEYKLKCPQGRIYDIKELLGNHKASTIILFKNSITDKICVMTANYTNGSGYLISCFELDEPNDNELTLSFKSELKISSLLSHNAINNHVQKYYLMSFGANKPALKYDERTGILSELEISLPEIKADRPGEIDVDLVNAVTSRSTMYIYDKGNSELTMMRLADNSVNKINLVGKYELYTMEGNINADEITFSGLRFSDGKNVVGTLDKQGVISVVESVGNATKETVLIRLN